MLGKDDSLYFADKALKDMRKRLDALKNLYKRMHNGIEWKDAGEKKFHITTQEMLQSSRNNIGKLKELSKRPNRRY